MALAKSVQSLVVSDAQRQVDMRMVPFDIWGTKAHVLMLIRQGIVSADNGRKILSALNGIEESYKAGTFEISPELGAQLTLEREVVQRAGDEAGLSMHTARSRNDQVMVTEALFLRAEGLELLSALAEPLEILLSAAEKTAGVPMPGYTHMQPGKPTAVSHWYLAHADALFRVGERIEFTLQQFDRSPLGSVESFGTSWPIDRLFVATLLGFGGVWEIPQDAISNRGAFQLTLLSDLSQLSLAISRVAVDVLQYSTFEYGYLDFTDDVAARLHPITGSSVMAQKRNPDAAELLRALAPQVLALEQAVGGVLSRLPTGYNRDSRETKELGVLALDKVKAGLSAFTTLAGSLRFNGPRMRRLVEENYSQTTDLADYLSQKTGQPYRRMYKIIGKAVDQLMGTGKPLSALTVEMLERQAKDLGTTFNISAKDLEDGLDVSQALERRKHVGGTRTVLVREMVANRRSMVRALMERVSNKALKVASAQTETERNVALFVKG